MSNDKNNQDLEFEQLMEQRIRDTPSRPFGHKFNNSRILH